MVNSVMYYKISDYVLFRKYNEYGYLTDNSEYGYKMLNDRRPPLGEKYVSLSGAIMLSQLNRQPQPIEDIIKKLLQFYTDVEYAELLHDTQDFFDSLVVDGFLCRSDDFDTCKAENIKGRISSSAHNNHIGKEDSYNISQNDFLRSIHFDITRACNERCVHCYIPNDCKNNFINPDLFYRIIEEGREMNVINVTLSGGEPLLHKDIIGFIRKCRELDLAVNLLSNLTLLTDEIILEMKKNPLLSVQASLYSTNNKVHDSITQIKGSCEKTKEGILKLCNHGIPVQISCPIMKQNKDSFSDVLQWGQEHNIAVVIEPVIFAAYDHSRCNIKNRLSIEEIAEVLTVEMSDTYVKSMIETAITKEKLTEDDPICSVCRYSFCISTNGKVFPCAGWQNYVIGDTKEQSISEIWKTSDEIHKLRQIKRSDFPKCVNCINRGYCTVCMMWNSNENLDGSPFRINNLRCEVAAMTNKKIHQYLSNKSCLCNV